MLLPAFSHFFHAYKDIFGFILFHFAGKGMGLKQLLFTAKQRPGRKQSSRASNLFTFGIQIAQTESNKVVKYTSQ